MLLLLRVLNPSRFEGRVYTGLGLYGLGQGLRECLWRCCRRLVGVRLLSSSGCQQL